VHGHFDESGFLADAAFAAAFRSVAIAGSETPPEGPPWTRELAAAQTQAIRERRPIFAYFTKSVLTPLRHRGEAVASQPR